MKTTISNMGQAWVIIVLLAFFVALPGTSLPRAADDGGYAGAFLRLDIDARAAGLGGAFTAIADGPAGFHYNPAGPAWEEKRVVEAAYRKMSFDRRYGSAAVVWPLHKEAAIVGSWVHAGVDDVLERSGSAAVVWPLHKEAAIVGSWVHAGVDDVLERSYEGEPGEKIGESNNAVSFTFAKKFTSFFSLGVNLRYVQMNIANINAYTVGFDFGMMLNLPRSTLAVGGPKGLTDFRFGLVVERINYKFPWNTQEYWVKEGSDKGSSFEERWPLNVRGGIATSVYDRHATLAVDVEVNEQSGAILHAGLEILPIPALALRGGINGEHFTAGAGVSTTLGKNTLFMDYALAMTDDILDDEHLVTIGVRF